MPWGSNNRKNPPRTRNRPPSCRLRTARWEPSIREPRRSDESVRAKPRKATILVLSMRALQHQSQDMEWKIAAIMVTRVSHGTIVRTKNGETTCVSRDAWLYPLFLEK